MVVAPRLNTSGRGKRPRRWFRMTRTSRMDSKSSEKAEHHSGNDQRRTADVERPDDYERPDDTPDASPIFGAIAVLLSVAFGIGTGSVAVTRHLGGQPLQSWSVLLPAGGAVVSLLVVAVFAEIVTWRSPTVPDDAPWTVRPAWQSLPIEEDLYYRSVTPRAALLPAAVGLMFGALLLGIGPGDVRDPRGLLIGWIATLGFLLFSLTPLLRVWHRRKYGTSTVTLEPFPGRLGQALDGHVRAGVDPRTMTSSRFQVTLRCLHLDADRDDEHGTQHPLGRCLWETEAHVQARPASDQGDVPADAPVVVPFSLDLPEEAPPSTPTKKPHRIAWMLIVSAKTKGLNYWSAFEIPVFKPEGSGLPGSDEA